MLVFAERPLEEESLLLPPYNLALYSNPQHLAGLDRAGAQSLSGTGGEAETRGACPRSQGQLVVGSQLPTLSPTLILQPQPGTRPLGGRWN